MPENQGVSSRPFRPSHSSKVSILLIATVALFNPSFFSPSPPSRAHGRRTASCLNEKEEKKQNKKRERERKKNYFPLTLLLSAGCLDESCVVFSGSGRDCNNLINSIIHTCSCLLLPVLMDCHLESEAFI